MPALYLSGCTHICPHMDILLVRLCTHVQSFGLFAQMRKLKALYLDRDVHCNHRDNKNNMNEIYQPVIVYRAATRSTKANDTEKSVQKVTK